MSEPKQTKLRDGDRMIVVDIRTEEAIVHLDDILEATRIEEDSFGRGPPWKEHDGWEHHLIIPSPEAKDATGFLPGHLSTDNTPHLIVLDTPDGWGAYPNLRANGASRQVAREKQAEIEHKALEQLATWYKQGYQWRGVICDFRGYKDSLWGILDDDGDYLKEVRLELAEGIAKQMELDGYTVEGLDDPRAVKKLQARYDKATLTFGSQVTRQGFTVRASMTAEDWKKFWQRRLHSQDAEPTRHWAASKAYRRALHRKISARDHRGFGALAQPAIDYTFRRPGDKA